MTARGARRAIGLVLVVVAIYLIASPATVGRVLHRPATTVSQWINLRASWGGPVLGFAGFLLWLPAWAPRARMLVGLLGWAMTGVAIARTVGFVLDGTPDGRQVFFLVAEIVIAAGSALGVRALARRHGAISPRTR